MLVVGFWWSSLSLSFLVGYKRTISVRWLVLCWLDWPQSPSIWSDIILSMFVRVFLDEMILVWLWRKYQLFLNLEPAGLWTGTSTSVSPNSQAFGLALELSISFPGSLPCHLQIWGFLSLEPIPYNKSLNGTQTHADTPPPTGLVHLKNPNTIVYLAVLLGWKESICLKFILVSIIEYLKKIFFVIVEVQCSVNFCCRKVTQSYTHTHIHTHIPFFTLSDIMFHSKWHIVCLE